MKAHPYFFGESSEQLYGVYHPGQSSRGVLLCYPLFQEYMRSHWACRQLSAALTARGFHVFRFDYFGTGDSAGDLTTASLDRWVENTHAAAKELRDTAGISRVTVVALRGGAIVAANALQGGLRAERLVLWDGVREGAPYMESLIAMHEERKGRAPPECSFLENEMLGMVIPPPLRHSIAAQSIDRVLLSLDIPTERIESTNLGEFAQWEDSVYIESALLTPKTIQAVVTATQGGAI